jgi:NADH-quinone oxidoreductase subunit N
MRIDTLLFKEIAILPELFLGLSLVYLILHCSFLAVKKKYLLIHNSILYLAVLVLFLSCIIVLNDSLIVLQFSSFNDTFIYDYVSFSSKLIVGSLALFSLLNMHSYIKSQKINQFEYILLILFAVLGLFLLCSSNDLLTAYLAIELQSLSFYVLAAFKKNSTYSVDAGIKYFILGAFSSSLFLFGSSLLYGVVGTINFEEFRDLLFDINFNNTDCLNIGLIKIGLIFILISLLFKLAMAPFHTWAPDVYEGSPSASTFFFVVVPKLAIFVLLLRIFYFGFYNFFETWRYLIVISILLSVIVGSFGGLEQKKLKSLFVYSSISHMGYALISFSAGTFESIQMLICYLIVYSFSGLCVWSIFLLTSLKTNYLQKQNKDLTDFVLLSKANYMLAIFFATVLFSIAGFPPMIGFLVKISVFLTSIESSMYFVAILSILCSVVGTFFYIRLIKILFFEKVLVGKLYYPITTQNSILVSFLFFLFIFLFINPTILYLFAYKFSLLFSVSVL